MERKLGGAYGSALVVTFIFEGEKRNLFLPKFFSTDDRFRPLLSMFRTPNMDFQFMLEKINQARDSTQLPSYEFQAVPIDPLVKKRRMESDHETI